jgi:hypothetical protein
MRDEQWVSLTDAQRGQLVAIWLLAADRDGVIPASPSLIQRLCLMEKRPNIQLFIDKGFIEGDATVTSERRQHDVPETEAEAEKNRIYIGNFDLARKAYPGKKRGLETEYENFRKKHKDWRDILEDDGLAQCIKAMVERQAYSEGYWPHFAKIINQRLWEIVT